MNMAGQLHVLTCVKWNTVYSSSIFDLFLFCETTCMYQYAIHTAYREEHAWLYIESMFTMFVNNVQPLTRFSLTMPSLAAKKARTWDKKKRSSSYKIQNGRKESTSEHTWQVDVKIIKGGSDMREVGICYWLHFSRQIWFRQHGRERSNVLQPFRFKILHVQAVC